MTCKKIADAFATPDLGRIDRVVVGLAAVVEELPFRTSKTPNKSLQLTGHATDGFSWHYANSA